MVRANRIKEYRFSIGSLTADSNGRMDVYSDHTINGTIQKVEFLGGNYTATGSIFVYASGTNEQIWYYSGACATAATVYPFVYPTNNANITGSPQVGAKRVITQPLRIVGSGLTASKSGLGLNVYYI
jgi:hypothetical protein